MWMCFVNNKELQYALLLAYWELNGFTVKFKIFFETNSWDKVANTKCSNFSFVTLSNCLEVKQMNVKSDAQSHSWEHNCPFLDQREAQLA